MLTRGRRRGAVSADEAVDMLYRTHAVPAFRLAYLMTGNGAVAEEIVQEAFVRTWQSWDRIRDVDSAYGYVRTSIINLSRSALRRKALEIRHRVTTREDARDFDVVDRIDTVRAVASLPPRQRACIALRFYEDLSEARTAEILGITVGGVKAQTAKALRRLAAVLGGDGDD
jgi:RNA polymerase sigma-70 factor (sigma-E family)